MSKELDFYKKGKSHVGRLAQTVHPGDSASQASTNKLFSEGEEAGGDAKAKLALARLTAQVEKGSAVSYNSKAMVPFGTQELKPASGVSKSSKAHSTLQIEDVSSGVSSSRGAKSNITTNSKALVPVNQALEKVSGSAISKASSKASTATPSRAVVKASDPKAIEATPSSVSKASSKQSSASKLKSTVSSASTAKPARSTISTSAKAKDNASSVSKASSTKSSSVSKSSSRASGRSKALVPAEKGLRKVSPLANEVRPEDLNDDVYSISIHEHGPLANIPNRDELLAKILHNNPRMDFDEASVVADNEIATRSQVGRSTVGSRIGGTMSDTGSAYKSSVSKATNRKGKEVERTAAEPSMVSRASSARYEPAPASALSSSSKALVLSNTGISPLLASSFATSSQTENSASKGTSTSDLLAIANLRQQRELARAQAISAFEANRSTAGTDLSRTRMAELELARQSLEDSRTLSRLQELGIHDDKLATLVRHAHEDQLSALQRAESSEADRRASLQIAALRHKEDMERARIRQKAGDIKRDEHRRDHERDQDRQMEYERLDHDQKMDKIDAFERMVEAGKPKVGAQPRRSGLHMEYEYRYRNPQTGGDGSVNMRISKGCAKTGDGSCAACGQDFAEHPLKLKSDGTVVGRSGRVILKSAGSVLPSEVSRASSSKTKRR